MVAAAAAAAFFVAGAAAVVVAEAIVLRSKQFAPAIAIGVAPAVVAALHDATGVWFDTFPLTPDTVLARLA